jgi:A118 family predicted phage portal protein
MLVGLWKNMWLKLKGVFGRMGIVEKLESTTDHKRIMSDSKDYINITNWLAIYQGQAPWIVNATYNTSSGRKRGRQLLSLNMPQAAAKKMATLTFSQKVVLTATKKLNAPQPTSPDDMKQASNVFIHQVFAENHFYDNFERYLEYMFAEGGLCMRLYTYHGKVKIRFATADVFFPISSDANGVTECVIASNFQSNNSYYTLLEWHTEDDTAYVVSNELYESTTADDLGHKVPLTQLYSDLAEETRYSKADYSGPTFIYLKPNLANNINLSSPLGIPIYANALDTLKVLDETYDALMREIKLSKKTLMVPDSMMKRGVDRFTGQPEFYYDDAEEIYRMFHYDSISGTSNETIKDVTQALRAESYLSTINTTLKLFASQVGFSAGTFSYDAGDGMKTATEVVSENSDTYQTKNSHETIIEEALKQLVIRVLELAKADPEVNYSDETDVDVTVNFDDSIAKDRSENLSYYMTASGGKPLMDQIAAIKRVNNVTDVEAQEIYDKIQAQQPDQGTLEDIGGGTE